jgi:thiol:disulfide interchange protein DsbC
MKKYAAVFAALVLAFTARAGDELSVEAVKDKIAKKLDIKREDIRLSPATGLYEVQHDHDFGYVTADGKFLLQGDLVNIDTGEQLTENRRRADRLAALKTLGEDNMIVFAPSPPVATRYVVTVFTDVDCGYCRKLHSQIADYNAQGIAIRYVFFPRTGPDTDSWHRAEAVWCSADRQSALTHAKLGENLKPRGCDNPVAREYQLGVDLGVHGTPMIVMPNGEIYPGYMPPKAMVSYLAKIDAEGKQANNVPAAKAKS